MKKEVKEVKEVKDDPTAEGVKVDKVEIDLEVINSVIKYLSSKPYVEVVGIMEAIKTSAVIK